MKSEGGKERMKCRMERGDKKKRWSERAKNEPRAPLTPAVLEGHVSEKGWERKHTKVPTILYSGELETNIYLNVSSSICMAITGTIIL